MPIGVNTYIYGKEELDYIKKLKEIFARKESPKAYIRTYGCQQNVSDSEKYRGMLEKAGFTFLEDYQDADVILFNTCAVRENAENKVFGNIGRIKAVKKANPNAVVVLAGCMTEQESIAKKISEVYTFVDIVLGTKQIQSFPKILCDFILNRPVKNKHAVIYTSKEDPILEDFPMKRNNKIKAFVSIMSGCNNFCSYCIVPYVRGRERSRNPEAIIKETQGLLNAGYKDITLLGQNVNSYGKDLGEGIDFCYLLKKLDALEGDFKLRFMTSHPKDATKELFDVIAGSKHISKHIHLPVQCGSNRVLKEMNRKYTKEDYLKKIEYAKSIMKDVSFTSDIIVGFPGETYEEFLETVDLIKKVEFSSLFTFIYSKRQGTPAAKMPDNVSKKEKTSWLLELLKVQEEISENLCKKMVGNEEKVLAESFENGVLSCRTDGNIVVKVPSEKDLTGQFVKIKITDSSRESLQGKII